MSDLEQGHPTPGQAQSSVSPISAVTKADRARAAREELVGKTIAGRYILRSLLGHGGMGAVYEGEHVGIGKKVAIKFVDPEFITDEQVLTRFAREARVMSTLESPHIVSIFDAGTEEGRPYLVMELLRGEDLGQRLRRTSRVPLAESLHITAMVLKGLAKAHQAGIIHRDLKPDNIFLVQHDGDPVFAKIVDFGVSKIDRPRNRTSPLALTGRGTVLGTPFYMSPEQAQAVPDLDGRADLFSVGTILFECLAGRPPFTGETYEQIILAICMNDAPLLRTLDPSIPEWVSKFVARALARDRNDRFANADEMLAALQAADTQRGPAAASSDKASIGKTLAFNGNSTAALGSNADATAAATPVNMKQASALVGEAVTPASVTPAKASTPASPAGRGAFGPATPSSLKSPLARSDSDHVPSVRPPGPRSSSAVIATAVVAAVLGVLATFALIFALKKDTTPIAPLQTTSGSTAAPASVVPASAVPASAAPSVTALPRPAVSAPAPSAKPAVAPSSLPVAAPMPLPIGSPKPVTSPRPTGSKSLDISRELP